MKRSRIGNHNDTRKLSEMTRQALREQRRIQRKKNKRKRIVKRSITTLVILALIGVISFFVYQAMEQGLFNVTEIEVVGNEIIDAQSVIDASGIQIGESIFLVDLNRANYQINALLNLDDLEITKIMPNKILVRMQESTPICAINFEDKVTYISRDYKLIENGDYLRKTDIPIIIGSESVTISDIGKKVVVEPYWRFDTIMNILKDLQDNSKLNKISEVRMTDNNTYEIVTKNGSILIVWDYDNFAENENYINNTLDQNTSNMIINLTAGTKPVVKPR
ncbi:cell division protein FtsQ/DivIB [Acetobacterium bakii]|uniref:Cell division protein FtsQ n=1 Tax=Acetobacterium bakii TaxID=52689 RepID=A0A0L6U643_9FIRM|nr:FtsQ-type POTRA domain-containing protein [Acetobacterium bakii]KNZ43265.1 cell division protein FtsQ [Acetobacterium bakii]